jgi:hypothetical protein
VLKNGKDYSFGIGDPQSTSGTLVPSYYVFTLNNLDPKTHFKVMRSSNHEGNFPGRPEQAGRYRDQQQRNDAEDEGEIAREAGADPHPVDFAADPARPAGLAQGPACRREEEGFRTLSSRATARTRARRRS